MNSQKFNTNCLISLWQFLNRKNQEIIDEAVEGLACRPLKHYKISGKEQNRKWLTNLFNLTLESIQSKNLIPMLEYTKKIAKERYVQNFDLQEIQSAFNVLEEVIWKIISDGMTPQEYFEAFGIVSTVLGFGKEALAVEYVSLVSKRNDIKSLDLSDLFQGV